jgi:hypothetical protein
MHEITCIHGIALIALFAFAGILARASHVASGIRVAHAVVFQTTVDGRAESAVSGVTVAAFARVVAWTHHEAVGILGAVATGAIQTVVDRRTVTVLARAHETFAAFASVLASFGECTVRIIITEVGAIFAPVDSQAVTLEAVGAHVATLAGAVCPSRANLKAHAILVAWVCRGANGGVFADEASATETSVARALALARGIIVTLGIGGAATVA